VCGLYVRLVIFMEDTRRWSVESKVFEMKIKGGASRVRIVKKSNNKQRSIFVQRDELAWLVGLVEVVMDMETSEVFWDQSRAGYPRLIVQKCCNRHGRFLTIEEFDGRRRSGTILIPEGRYGQGWARLILELKMVSSSLWKGSEFRERKTEIVASGRRSFAEVVGLSKPSEEECFPAYKEPIARVPMWLKESVVALEDQNLVSSCGGHKVIPSKTHFQMGTVQDSVEPGGCLQLVDGLTGVLKGTTTVNWRI
jgi:hypothetical protein